MKWFWRLVLVAIVVFAAWRIWQRIFVTDEQRVKNQLAGMVRAVEKGDVLRLSDALAADYSDDWGLDKSTLLGAVRSFRSQYDALFIHISDLKVTVDPDHQTAQAIFIAKVLAKAKGSVTPNEIRADRFRLHFRKVDSTWKLERAESPELKFD